MAGLVENHGLRCRYNRRHGRVRYALLATYGATLGRPPRAGTATRLVSVGRHADNLLHSAHYVLCAASYRSDVQVDGPACRLRQTGIVGPVMCLVTL